MRTHTQASRPFFAMLETWVYDGLITDPHLEFMVQHVSQVAGSEPIHMDCVLVEENTPSFLQDVADLILETGRYLRVLAQCGACPVPTQTHTEVHTHRHTYTDTHTHTHTQTHTLEVGYSSG